MRFPDASNPVMRFLSVLGDLVLINFYFVLCSLPIITFGASATAAYSALIRLINDRQESVTRDFFQAFKRNFGKATGLWLIELAFTGVMLFDLLFALSSSGVLKGFFMAFSAIGLIASLIALTFGFPLLARYDESVRQLLINSFKLAAAFVPQMLLLWAIWFIPIAASYFFIEVFAYLGFIWLMCGFSGLLYISARVFTSIFKRLEVADDNH